MFLKQIYFDIVFEGVVSIWMCLEKMCRSEPLWPPCVRNRLTGKAELAAGLNEQVIVISPHFQHIMGEKHALK